MRRATSSSRACITVALGAAAFCAGSPATVADAGRGPAAVPSIQDRVDWAAFLARHDLIWKAWPTGWGEAPWFGNGLVGSMIWKDKQRNLLRMQVFRSDVQLHRSMEEHGHAGYSRCRLQIGSFYLHTAGELTSCDWRLRLHGAELTGRVTTTAGRIDVRHFVHAQDNVIYTELAPSGGERIVRWEWAPEEAMPTRGGYPTRPEAIPGVQRAYNSPYPTKVFEPNPPPAVAERDGCHISFQALRHGGCHAVAWKEIPSGEHGRILLVSIGKRWPDEEQRADDDALAAVGRVAGLADRSPWQAKHYDWWRSYYPASFVSLPDARMETLYWVQMYKLASATRADCPIMDTAGIWQSPSKWPFITWNLNVQLCYWPTVGSNRLDIGLSLVHNLDKYKRNLIANVRPVEWQEDSAYLSLNTGMDLYQPADVDRRGIGNAPANLTWAMHNCWLIYRHGMDDALLREKVYPLLRRSVNYLIRLLEEGQDGRLHMPVTNSPEYKSAPDCNYQLAALRWGCATLLRAARRLGVDDPLTPTWRKVLARMADFPVHETEGFMIGAGARMDSSHRHFSHLVMAYPYYLVNADQKGAGDLIERSVKHWISHKGALQGYSFTGASSLASTIGRGNESLGYLEGLIPFLQRNGMYKEAGPCLETPLSAAQSIHDMLIQSWSDPIAALDPAYVPKVRVFPAVPERWRDVVFRDLLAEGAFAVSARRREGKTAWVRITSLAGEPCVLKADLGDDPEIAVPEGVSCTRLAADTWQLGLGKGQSALLRRKGASGPPVVEPLGDQSGPPNFFGLAPGKG